MIFFYGYKKTYGEFHIIFLSYFSILHTNKMVILHKSKIKMSINKEIDCRRMSRFYILDRGLRDMYNFILFIMVVGGGIK